MNKITVAKKYTSSLNYFPGSVLLLVVLLSSGCSADKDGDIDQEPTFAVKLASSTTLGNYLTDKDCRTLYYFSNDSVTVNTCTSATCMATWPKFFAGISSETLGDGLEQSDFDTIMSSGSMQLAYKGRPLYYYAPGTPNTPEAAGQTTGDGVGGVWFVAKPDYTIMLTRAQLVGLDGKNYTFTIASPTPTYTEANGKSVYFTDAYGRTLYIFRNDKRNTNNCTSAGCKAQWPVYETTDVVVPSTIDKTLFGNITLPDGKKQMTYKGWPLYYFTQDNMVMGATKGVTFPAVGVWPVGAQDLAEAPAP